MSKESSMVDLSRINAYLEFYRKSYEFLKIKFIYNPMGFYANLFVFDVVTENRSKWTFGVNGTEDANRKIDLCLMDFFAKESRCERSNIMRDCKYESEGYCDKKEKFLNPQECKDCKMHEFTLCSATKYKDGTPIMSEPKVDINSSYSETKAAKNSMFGKCASNQLDDEVPEGFHRTPFGLMPNGFFHPDNDYLKEDASREQIIEFANATADDVEQLKDFIYNDEDPEGYSHYKLVKETAQRVFDLNLKLENYVEEYDAVLKTHGDTLEEHLDRICELENMYANVLEDLCVMKERLCKITSLITDSDKYAHIFENFCGNCTHVNKCRAEDGIYACELSGEIVDPDSASCSMFEPPF